MDRSNPLGNSDGVDLRRALHVKIRNADTDAIPVFIVEEPTPPTTIRDVITPYNSISSVGTGILTNVITYTVPVASTFFLERIFVGGSNIATYAVLIDAVPIAQKRTWFSGDISVDFEFESISELGVKLIEGQVITVTVIHNRPDVGDFESTIIGVLVG